MSKIIAALVASLFAASRFRCRATCFGLRFGHGIGSDGFGSYGIGRRFRSSP